VYLQHLESEKDDLEKELSFKKNQGSQYEKLLENVREQCRQLQVSETCILIKYIKVVQSRAVSDFLFFF